MFNKTRNPKPETRNPKLYKGFLRFFQILSLFFLLPHIGEAQNTSRNFFGKKLLEQATPIEGYDQAFCRSQTKPAYAEIISQEIMQVNGTIQGHAWLWANDTLQLQASQISFQLPQGWSGTATLPQNYLNAGDSLQVSFTLTYPTQSLPFYPQEVTIEIPTNVESFVATASSRAYFTPYNTVEFFNVYDFYAQPRVWLSESSLVSTTRRYIDKRDIPVSDINPMVDTLENLPTYAVRLEGLAYDILMKADTTMRTDTTEYDATLQKRIVIGPRVRFRGCIRGNIRSLIRNDVNLPANIPLSGIYLELREDDGFWGDQIFARTHTDAQGNFELCYDEWQSRWSEGTDIELHIRTFSQNKNHDIYATGAWNPSPFLNPILAELISRTGIFKENIPIGTVGTNFTLNNFTIQTGNGAFRAVNWATRAWEYTEQTGGYGLHRSLRIRLHRRDGGLFLANQYLNGMFILAIPTIHINVENGVNNENTVYHEFGHFMMWSLQGKNFLIPEGNPGEPWPLIFGHTPRNEASLSSAWIEGWANGMMAIYDAAHWWEDREYGRDDLWGNNYENRANFAINRGFLSEYHIGCAIYDMWDGAGKNVPTLPAEAGLRLGFNDGGTDTPFGGTGWNDDAEFAFRDLLTPLVQRNRHSVIIFSVMQYFYQFLDHTIPTNNCEARRLLARTFDANQVNNSVQPITTNIIRVPTGSLSGDPIRVQLMETYPYQTPLGGFGVNVYVTFVNPNWANYFNQTRTIAVSQQTSNNAFRNRFISENLSVQGAANITPSRIVLTGSQTDLPYTTCGNPRLVFQNAEFELLNASFEINGTSLLQMQQNGRLKIGQGMRLVIGRGATLNIQATATLEMLANAEIVVEEGGYICVEQGATLNIHSTASINLIGGAITGVNPALGIVTANACNQFYAEYDAVYTTAAQYVDLPNINNRLSVGSGDFTWVFNFRTEQLDPKPEKYTLISTRTASNNGYQFGFNKYGWPFLQIAGIDVEFASTVSGSHFPLNNGHCYQIVLRRTNGIFQIAVDGMLANQSTTTYFQNIDGNPRLTKDRLEGNTTAFVGWLGEAQFWNRSLSATEIFNMAHFTPNRVSFVGIPAGLMAYYEFKELANSQIVVDKLGICHGWLGSNATSVDVNDPTRIKFIDLACFSTPTSVFRATLPTDEPTKIVEVVKAYPNPFENVFTLEIPASYGEVVRMEICNLQGIVVETAFVPAGKVSYTLRKALPKGIYILRLVGKTESTNLRISKQ